MRQLWNAALQEINNVAIKVVEGWGESVEMKSMEAGEVAEARERRAAIGSKDGVQCCNAHAVASRWR